MMIERLYIKFECLNNLISLTIIVQWKFKLKLKLKAKYLNIKKALIFNKVLWVYYWKLAFIII